MAWFEFVGCVTFDHIDAPTLLVGEHGPIALIIAPKELCKAYEHKQERHTKMCSSLVTWQRLLWCTPIIASDAVLPASRIFSQHHTPHDTTNSSRNTALTSNATWLSRSRAAARRTRWRQTFLLPLSGAPLHKKCQQAASVTAVHSTAFDLDFTTATQISLPKNAISAAMVQKLP